MFIEENSYRKARKRVDQLKGFYSHLTIFIVITGITLISGWIINQNLFYSFIIGFAGWGIGVLAHAVNTFGLLNFFDADWERRKVKELMERENDTHD